MTSLISLITPTNLLEEKEKFFGSSSYNPTFSYIWQDQDIDPIFKDKKNDLWKAVKAQQYSQITSAAKVFFEVDISDSTLATATTHASSKGKKASGSAEQYAQLTRDGLDYFGLGDVEVILTDQAGFNARPQHKDKKILVSRHIQFEYFSMEGGVHHELVHTIRYYNGHFNQIKRSSNYLPTEEGLASWCQDNTNDDNGIAQHAMEYVASSAGVKGSLRDVYNCFVDLGASPELAWKRASRHKFGFINTSLPGDIMKPAMYYFNEMKVASLNTQEKLRLFVGKISLDQLTDHPTYLGRWSDEQLIEYFNLQGETL